ncbi:hypothetical protein, partial [Escherichia coli]|uniref:hypothetical protein n=1 Tax=Escherichia coli TaxID=562 RepID=UPI0039BE0AA2
NQESRLPPGSDFRRWVWITIAPFVTRFYEGAISEHLQIGIRAIDLLRAEGDRLHSRKLRTFNEPPFR